MRFAYERTATHSYMVVKEVDFTFDGYLMKMLQNNRIPGLLEMKALSENGQTEYWYDITGHQPLEEPSAGKKIRWEALCGLVRNLCDVRMVMETYLLDAEDLVYQTKHIFRDRKTGGLLFCYVPGLGKVQNNGLHQLMEEILEYLDHGDVRVVRAGYALYELCAEPGAGVPDLLACIREGEPASTQESAQRSVQESAKRSVQEFVKYPDQNAMNQFGQNSAKDPDQDPFKRSMQNTMKHSVQNSVKQFRHGGARKGELLPSVEGAISSDREAELLLSEAVQDPPAKKKRRKFARHIKKDRREKDRREKERKRNDNWTEEDLLGGSLSFLREEDARPYESAQTYESGITHEGVQIYEGGITHEGVQSHEGFGPYRAKAPQVTEVIGEAGIRHGLILIYKGIGNEEDLRPEKFPYLIGKAEGEADGVISARTVSRSHARIIRDGESFCLEDLNSTNGTYVNGELLPCLTSYPIRHTDRILFGDEEYQVAILP